MIQTNHLQKEKIKPGMWCFAVTLSKFNPFTWEIHKVKVDAVHDRETHVFDDIEISTPKGVRCNPLVGRVSGLMVSHWYLFAGKVAALDAAAKFNRYDATQMLTRMAEQNVELKNLGGVSIYD